MKKRFTSIITAAAVAAACVLSASAATYQTIDVAAMIADKENWTGTWTADETRISETTIGADFIELAGKNIKSATNPNYTGQDFRLDYKLKITWPEDAYDWGSIVTFHDKDPGMHVWEQGRLATYGVFYKLDSSMEDITKAGSVSIAKWNQPVTHNGDPEGLGDDSAVSGLDLSGKEYVYNLFVEDVADGVHIMLYMSGKLVIDITDKGTVKNNIDSPPIKGSGGFTILQHAPRQVLFSVVKPGEQPVLQTPTPAPTSPASSKASSASSSAAASSVTSSEEISSGDVSSDAGSSEEASSGGTVSESSQSTVEESAVSSEVSQASGDEGKEGLPAGLIIGIAVLVILAAGAAGAFIILKKKKG